MTKAKKITPAMRFAEEHGLKLVQVRRLRLLADRVAKTGENESNYGDGPDLIYKRATAKAQTDFSDYAKECGFDGYEMPGLYPTLSKGENKYIDLPG